MEKYLIPIKHTAFINVSVAKVYETLTTGSGWDGWFTHGTIVDIDNKRIKLVWSKEGPYKATGIESGPIVSVIQDKEFVFVWHEGKHNTTVTFSLAPEINGTRITVTESGYLPTEEGMWQMMDCACGWGEAITLLKFYLEHGVTY